MEGIAPMAQIRPFRAYRYAPRLTPELGKLLTPPYDVIGPEFQDELYALLNPLVERFGDLPEDERHEFRSLLTDYVRLYAFLAQILTFADVDLEKLYVFARYLRRLLPADPAELPREVLTADVERARRQAQPSVP